MIHFQSLPNSFLLQSGQAKTWPQVILCSNKFILLAVWKKLIRFSVRNQLIDLISMFVLQQTHQGTTFQVLQVCCCIVICKVDIRFQKFEALQNNINRIICDNLKEKLKCKSNLRVPSSTSLCCKFQVKFRTIRSDV